jgi:hypothetical protein
MIGNIRKENWKVQKEQERARKSKRKLQVYLKELDTRSR